MLIGFCLGCIHKFINQYLLPATDMFPANKNEWINFFRMNQKEIGDFNAIEIIMTPLEERWFSISKDNYSWLKSMKHISYHLTQCTKETENAIQQLPFISNIVCHVSKKSILTYDFLKKYLNKICFENIEGADYPFFKEEKICFDFAHAMSIDNSYVNNFYKVYNRQIIEIHLSIHDPELKHIPFHNKVSKCFKFSIPIKHNCPVIIESAFNNIEEMKKELQFIKERI